MGSTKLVWTSDPEAAKKLRETGPLEARRDAEPAKQTIRVAIDRKKRGGKSVTVASGFQHAPETLTKLAASLKKKCGAGGTNSEDAIEIQGERVDELVTELTKLGYKVKRG